MEYHGLWRLPQICQIARALDDYDVYWHEDPVLMHRFDDIARFKEVTTSRVAGSENLGTKTWYLEAFERGAIDVAHFDLAWIGGLTEGRKIAAIAEAYERPIAPHDCVGPVTLAASTHLVARPATACFRKQFVPLPAATTAISPRNSPKSTMAISRRPAPPGMGLELVPGFTERADATVRRSTLAEM